MLGKIKEGHHAMHAQKHRKKSRKDSAAGFSSWQKHSGINSMDKNNKTPASYDKTNSFYRAPWWWWCLLMCRHESATSPEIGVRARRQDEVRSSPHPKRSHGSCQRVNWTEGRRRGGCEVEDRKRYRGEEWGWKEKREEGKEKRRWKQGKWEEKGKQWLSSQCG